MPLYPLRQQLQRKQRERGATLGSPNPLPKCETNIGGILNSVTEIQAYP